MKKVKIIDFKNCSLLHYFQSQWSLFVIVIETSFYFLNLNKCQKKSMLFQSMINAAILSIQDTKDNISLVVMKIIQKLK